MDKLFEILFGWWWYGKGGRTTTADAADKFLLPVLLLAGAGCLVALLIAVARR